MHNHLTSNDIKPGSFKVLSIAISKLIHLVVMCKTSDLYLMRMYKKRTVKSIIKIYYKLFNVKVRAINKHFTLLFDLHDEAGI